MTTDFAAMIAEGVGNEIEISATLEGIAPGLLMHSGASMALAAAWAAKESSGRKKVIPEHDVEAEWGVYRNRAGDLVLPAPNFQRALVEAGKAFRSPTRKMATMTREVAAGVIIPAGVESYVLVDPDGVPIREYEVDVRRANVQRQSIMRARPLVREWGLEARLWLDPLVVSPEVVLRVMMLAGRTIGLGDYRPERSGPFGRY